MKFCPLFFHNSCTSIFHLFYKFDKKFWLDFIAGFLNHANQCFTISKLSSIGIDPSSKYTPYVFDGI